jgi:hypothetical protein
MSVKRGSGPKPPDPLRTPDTDAVPPPRGVEGDDRWTVDHIIELKTLCSRLTETVATLGKTVAEQGSKIETLGRTVDSAKAGLKVIWWIAGIGATMMIFVVVRLWGPLMTIVAKVATAAVSR